MIDVEVSNRQTALKIDAVHLRDVVAEVLNHEGIAQAEISVAVVGDVEIHDLNRRYLRHDYATDVLSFVLERSEERLEGEIIVSAETALARCREYGWEALDELRLYLIHGTLHLLGYDDTSAESRSVMRQREDHHWSRIKGSRTEEPTACRRPRRDGPYTRTSRGSVRE